MLTRDGRGPRVKLEIPDELGSNRTIISRASHRGDEMAGGGCDQMRPSNAQALRSDATRWLECPDHRHCVPLCPRCGPGSRHRNAHGGRGILPLYPERSCQLGLQQYDVVSLLTLAASMGA